LNIFAPLGKKNLFIAILMLIIFLFMSSMSAVSSAYGIEVGKDGAGTSEEDVYFILDKIVHPVEGQCNVFDVELKIHVEQEPSTTPCDVVLVMDSSGSMDEGEEPWAIQYAQTAARDFAEDILAASSASRVAVVGYNSAASLKQSLSSNFSKIEDAIDNLRADGRTNMEAGFVKAMREIDANAKSSSNKAIVLLSDGVANQSGYHKCSVWPTASTECTDAAIDTGAEAQESAAVYTVGLFSGLNSEHPECLDIARETLQGAQSGGYFETMSAANLAQIYMDIAGQVIYEIDSADVRDIVSSHFEVIPDSISDGGVLGTDNKISWSVNTACASKDISLSYQVKWAGNEPCGIYEVNDDAYLEYLNPELDDAVRVDFPLDKDDVQVRCINLDGVPGIDLMKTVSPDRQYRGKEVDYTITIENVGDIDLSTVLLTDELLGLENYSIGDLPAGEKYIYTSSYEIPSDWSESYVENTASTTARAYTGDNEVIIEDSDQVRIYIRKKNPSGGGGGGFVPHEPVIIPEEPEVVVVPEIELVEPEPALPQTGADYFFYNMAGSALIAAGLFIRRRKN